MHTLDTLPRGGAVFLDDVDTVFRESAAGGKLLVTAILHARQVDITWILAAKVPSQVPPAIRDNADWLFYQVFREERYLDWIEGKGLPITPPPGGPHAFWVTDLAGTVYALDSESLALLPQ